MAKTKYGQRMYRARKKAGDLRTAAQTSMLTSIEDNLHTRKTEHVAFVDDSGNIVAHKTDHKSGSVNLSGISKRAVGGTMATHNHPDDNGYGFGGVFSPDDLWQVSNFGLKGIRAAAKEGTYEVIKNDANADIKSLASAYQTRAQRAVNQEMPKMKQASRDYNAGLITYQQCCDIYKQGNANITQRLSRWLGGHAGDYGFTYTFTRRG